MLLLTPLLLALPLLSPVLADALDDCYADCASAIVAAQDCDSDLSCLCTPSSDFLTYAIGYKLDRAPSTLPASYDPRRISY
ncbi:hypothetical protein BZA70DRAFT_282735 [Myxozyma melibiosi]|uniref:Extracellular membrane protein CFEM domain-containing protein n=1 Tax=Myxozyma melibiosi TaxID=54550 RepID=A0ABR1F145_9ASCO